MEVTPLDVSDPVAISAFPGSFLGLESDGNDARLATLGVADFTISGIDGEALQLEMGHFAVIELPAPG